MTSTFCDTETVESFFLQHFLLGLLDYIRWLPRELRIKRVVRRRLGLAVAAAAQPMDLQRQIRISSDKPFAVGSTLYGIHPVSSDF
nr:unnamed protein product [Haemonchus contortus]